VEAAVVEQDMAGRKKLYDRAQIILTEEDVPIMPLFQNVQNLMVKPYVKGFRPNAMDIIHLKDVRLEK
jgi:ABC-type transport system substrate-binding protein